MTVVEWLRFIQARSQVDQDWMQAVMTRVLLRRVGWTGCVRECSSAGGWLTIVIVGVYGTTRSLDGARRSAYNDRQLLMEFRSQSQRLQDEMAGDVERLQDQLTEADGAAATSGEKLLKLVVVDHKRTINFFTVRSRSEG
jgi:hypothetical protein